MINDDEYTDKLGNPKFIIRCGCGKEFVMSKGHLELKLKRVYRLCG